MNEVVRVEELNSQKNKIMTEIEEREEKIKQAQEEIKQAEAKNQADTQQLIDDLKKMVETSQKEITELKETLKKTSDELLNLESQLAQSRKNIDAQLNKTQPTTETPSTETQKHTPEITPESQPQTQSTTTQNAQQNSTNNTTTTTNTQTNTENKADSTSQTPLDKSQTPPQTAGENTENTATADTTSSPEATPTAPIPTPDTPDPHSETHSEAQQEQQINTIFNTLSTLPIQNNGIMLSQMQIQQLFQLEQLVQQAQLAQKRDYTYAEMLANPNRIDQQIANNKEQIKENKKLRKKLNKLNKSEEKLAKSENRINYQGQRLANTRNIREILATGAYLDGTVHFPKEQKLVFELYKNREKLRSQAIVPITIDGQEIQIYNESLTVPTRQGVENLVHCNQPVNIIEKLLVENTKMSLDQARSASKIVTTVGVVAGAFYGLKRLLGSTDKDTKERSFNLSPKKFITAAAVIFGGKRATEAITGKNPLEIVNHLWKTGKFPSFEETQNQSTEQKLALNQNTAQLALLGVPYATLAEITTPKSGPINTIDLPKLESYIQNQITLAQAAGDQTKINQLGTQLQAIQDFKNNPNAQTILNQYLAGLNINAQDISNPQNQTLVLDQRLSVEQNKLTQLTAYLNAQNLIINPTVENIQQELQKLPNPISEADLQTLRNEEKLIPKNGEISKLQIDQKLQAHFHLALHKLGNSAKFNNIQLSALDGETIKLTSDGQETHINTKTLSIPGLSNTANQALTLSSAEEVMHLALQINQLKSKFWSQMPDLKLKNEENRPFSQPSGRENLTAWQGIIFKQAGSTQEALTSTIPFFDQMNQFPTIEKAENRQLLINYLNAQRKKDHQTQ